MDDLATTAGALLLLAIWLVGIYVLVASVHSDLSRPLKRSERARFFLDLMEAAMNSGQSVEGTIVTLARRRDKSFDKLFQAVAGRIERGERVSVAIANVPNFLPQQIVAILQAGERLGDTKLVIPACRELLNDSKAPVRTAVNYMLVLACVFSPLFVTVIIMMGVMVVPKMREVMNGMEATLPNLAVFVFGNIQWIIGLEVLVFVFLVAMATAYMGATRYTRWIKFGGVPLIDRIAWRTPWNRKRLQRTFSAMLSVLLDGGVPEAEAVRIAGDCTVNEICRQRVQKIIERLKQGVKLDEAVAVFDDSGEFRWRLKNASHAHGGFLKALRGWHESLDAKAFQEQEATAHVVTSGLVIFNGVLVALIATSMFGMLVSVLEGVSP